MFDLKLHLSQPQVKDGWTKADEAAYAIQAARHLYHSTCIRGWLSRLWATLMGKATALIHLGAIQEANTICACHYIGVQPVPISQIRGSEGRCGDFDALFHPLKPHNKERWLRVAIARYMGLPLPPVTLIRIGETYFVRDGHHRVSVAQALDERYLDAEVTDWQVAGSIQTDGIKRATPLGFEMKSARSTVKTSAMGAR